MDSDGHTDDIVGLFDELGLLVFVHGAMYMTFAALEQPQLIRAVGLHQTTGDCNSTTSMRSILGHVCILCVSALKHSLQ